MVRTGTLRLLVALTLFGVSALGVSQAGLGSTNAQEAQACIDIQTLHANQDRMLPGRTVRFDFLEPVLNPAAPPEYQLEAGRICVEPGAAIPDAALDCPPPDEPCDFDEVDGDYLQYAAASTLYVESGTLSFKRKGSDGTVILYKNPVGTATPGGYTGVSVAAGSDVVMGVGDSVLFENTLLKFWNPDSAQPAVLFVTGFIGTEIGPSCVGTNCWIPS
jgi:hypothetical protein